MVSQSIVDISEDLEKQLIKMLGNKLISIQIGEVTGCSDTGHFVAYI
jgi:hypothetical protein